MARYIGLMSWTDQGISNDKDTTTRSVAFNKLLESQGGKLVDMHWTLGPYDIVVVMEAPNDEAIAAVMLKLGSLDNVRTVTMRAFTSDEVDSILAKVG